IVALAEAVAVLLIAHRRVVQPMRCGEFKLLAKSRHGIFLSSDRELLEGAHGQRHRLELALPDRMKHVIKKVQNRCRTPGLAANVEFDPVPELADAFVNVFDVDDVLASLVELRRKRNADRKKHSDAIEG